MKEEKSMIVYKEPKGIFHWLKSKFENLKQKFKTTKESQKKDENEVELFEKDLEVVMGGGNGITLSENELEERKAQIETLGKKSWALTQEQKDFANSREPKDKDELFEEELDQTNAGFPIIDDDQR